MSGTLNERVLERVARFGSGWIPWGPAANDLEASIPRVHEALSAAGRDPDNFQVAGRLPVVKGADGHLDLAASMDRVPPLVEAGVTDFRANPRLPDDRAAVGGRLHELVSAFRAVVG